MRILVCSSRVPFIQGGNELVVGWLVSELRARGYEVDEISLPLIWQSEVDVEKSYIMWRMLNVRDSLEIPADMVICSKFPSFVIQHPIKVIWLFHQFRQVYDWAGTDLGYQCDSVIQLGVREKIIAIDNQAFHEAQRLFSISYNVAGRLKKYNGFDSEVLYPFPPVHEEYQCKAYDDYFLHVGRLERNKRVDLLIEAIKESSVKMPLIIVGEGTEKKVLQQKVASYQLEDWVKFLGWVDRKKLLDLYSKAFAVLFAAYDEDFGLVVPEAFLSSKAVIATADSGGAIEIMNKNIHGMVCEPNSSSFAACIEKAVLSKNKVMEMGKNGYEMIHSWSWDSIIDKLIS